MQPERITRQRMCDRHVRFVAGAGRQGLIAVENLVKRFGGVVAVDGCTLEVATGSMTGLIGPNGAGKTTLFNLIAGFFPPTAGRVLLDGRDVTGRRTHELFHLGLVRTFQIPHEFSRMTVLENLLVVPPGQSGERLATGLFGWGRVRGEEARIRERAGEVLDFLRLAPVAKQPAGALSGGQKKLLELGRAMMSGARTLLLDEPAAGVNRTLLGTLREDLARLHREGYTCLVIEHDMDFIGDLCDPIYVMAEGRVLMRGTMAEIRANREVQEAYLGGAGGGSGAGARTDGGEPPA
jgi:branched-chain amino acid transport system ATP-binding protein